MRNKALDFNYDCKRIEKVIKECITKAKHAENDDMKVVWLTTYAKFQDLKYRIGRDVLGVQKLLKPEKEPLIQNDLLR